MLATIIFSIWWILFATTEGLCKQLAHTILVLANGSASYKPPLGLANFTAVVIQTVVCLLLYFRRRVTFAFNTLFALYKIVYMIVLFAAGMNASRRPDSGWKDFGVTYPGYTSSQALGAMAWIILSYQGWENANYVRAKPAH